MVHCLGELDKHAEDFPNEAPKAAGSVDADLSGSGREIVRCAICLWIVICVARTLAATSGSRTPSHFPAPKNYAAVSRPGGAWVESQERAGRTHLDQHPRLHQLEKRRGVAGAVERLPKALRTNPTDERFDLKAQILKK